MTGILPAIDPKENAAFLEALPGRIVTVPMLHHLYSRHIKTVLLLLWSYALCCRLLRPRHGVTQLYALGSSCLVLPVLWFADADWLKSCTLAIATIAALCGGLVDGLGLLATLTCAREGWTITAITLTVAYAVWAKGSRDIYGQPDFVTFLARLRPSPLAPNVPEEDEDRGCLVCWSSDEAPLQLPCHEGHKVCRDCLPRMYSADKYRCPFCLKQLFVYNKSQSYRSFLYHIIITNNFLRLTFSSIVVALLLYKGYYWRAATRVFLAALSVSLEWCMLYRLTGNWDLANTRVTVLWLLIGLTACDAWYGAGAVQLWDQVRLWDGEVLKGVEIWDTYPVVKEWYAAAV